MDRQNKWYNRDGDYKGAGNCKAPERIITFTQDEHVPHEIRKYCWYGQADKVQRQYKT